MKTLESRRSKERKMIAETLRAMRSQMAAGAGQPEAAETPWIMYMDDKLNCAYFYNAMSGETTWDEPAHYVTHESVSKTHSLSPDKKSKIKPGSPPSPNAKRSSLGGNGSYVVYSVEEMLDKVNRFIKWSSDRNAEFKSRGDEHAREIDTLNKHLSITQLKASKDRVAAANEIRALKAQEEGLAKQMSTLRAELEQKQNELSEKEATMSATGETLEQMRSAARAAEAKIKESQDAVSAQCARADAAEANAAEAKQSLETTAAALDVKATETKQLRAKIALAETHAADVTAQFEECKAELAQSRKAESASASAVAEFKKSTESLRAKLAASEQTIGDQREIAEALQSEAKNLRQDVQTTQQQLTAAEKTLAAREAALTEANASATLALAKVKKLESTLSDVQAKAASAQQNASAKAESQTAQLKAANAHVVELKKALERGRQLHDENLQALREHQQVVSEYETGTVVLRDGFFKIKKRLEEQAAALTATEAALSTERCTAAALRNDVKSHMSTISGLRKAKSALESAVNEAGLKATALQDRITALEEANSGLETEKKIAVSQLEKANETISASRSQISDLETRLSEASTQISTLESDKTQLTTARKADAAQTKELRSAIEQARAKLATAQGTARANEKAAKIANARVSDQASRIASLETSLESTRNALDQAKSSGNAAREQAAKAATDNMTLRSQAQAATSKLAETQASLAQSKLQTSGLKSKLAAAQALVARNGAEFEKRLAEKDAAYTAVKSKMAATAADHKAATLALQKKVSVFKERASRADATVTKQRMELSARAAAIKRLGATADELRDLQAAHKRQGIELEASKSKVSNLMSMVASKDSDVQKERSKTRSAVAELNEARGSIGRLEVQTKQLRAAATEWKNTEAELRAKVDKSKAAAADAVARVRSMKGEAAVKAKEAMMARALIQTLDKSNKVLMAENAKLRQRPKRVSAAAANTPRSSFFTVSQSKLRGFSSLKRRPETDSSSSSLTQATKKEKKAAALALRTVKKEHNAMLEKMRERQASLVQKVSAGEAALKKANHELAKAKRATKAATHRNADTIRKLEVQLAECTAQLSEVSKRAERFRAEHKSVEHRIHANEGKATAWQHKFEAANNRADTLKTKLEETQGNYQKATKQVSDLTARIATTTRQQKKHQAMLDKFEAALKDFAAKEASGQRDGEGTMQKMKELIDENARLQAQLGAENESHAKSTTGTDEIKKLRAENARLVTQRNPKQRIHLHQQIKMENQMLQAENTRLRKHIQIQNSRLRASGLSPDDVPKENVAPKSRVTRHRRRGDKQSASFSALTKSMIQMRNARGLSHRRNASRGSFSRFNPKVLE